MTNRLGTWKRTVRRALGLLAASAVVALVPAVQATAEEPVPEDPATTTTTTAPPTAPEVTTTSAPEVTTTTAAATPAVPSVAPTDVEAAAALTGVAQVVGGSNHTCARLTNMQVKCWGKGSNGRIGDGTSTDRPKPTTVKNVSGTGPLINVTQIAAGGSTTCVRISNTQARCWGGAGFGNVGNGSVNIAPKPVVVKK